MGAMGLSLSPLRSKSPPSRLEPPSSTRPLSSAAHSRWFVKFKSCHQTSLAAVGSSSPLVTWLVIWIEMVSRLQYHFSSSTLPHQRLFELSLHPRWSTNEHSENIPTLVHLPPHDLVDLCLSSPMLSLLRTRHLNLRHRPRLQSNMPSRLGSKYIHQLTNAGSVRRRKSRWCLWWWKFLLMRMEGKE